MIRRILSGLLGSFRLSSPAERRRVRRPVLECLEARDLMATLTPIADGSTYPYSAVVHIEADFPNGATFQGTGTMIDRFHVVTAGHVIHNARQGGDGWATQVRVFAGQTGSTQPFGTAYATYERTFNSFIADDNASPTGAHLAGDGDIGLITLDRDLGDQTGWFGYGYNDNDAFFAGRGMNTMGYPAQEGYSGQDMYFQYGAINGALAGTSSAFGALYWNQSSIRFIPGQSGSGLYDYNAGDRRIYGVMDVYNGTYGYAERITSGAFNALQSWVAADVDPMVPGSAPVTPATDTAFLAEPATGAAAVGGNLGNAPAPMQAAPATPLNAAVLSWATDRMGTSVGDGECWALVHQALLAAGADTSGDASYVFGAPIDLASITPGDVLQFENVRFEGAGPSPGTTYWQEFPHHTAIVYAVDGNQVTLINQNVNGDRTVQLTTINLGDWQSGTIDAYRPQLA